MGWGKRSKKRNFEWIGLKVVLCWLKLLLFEKFQETTTALENRVMVYKLVLIICWTWSSKFRGRLFIWWLFNHIMRLDREILKKKLKKMTREWKLKRKDEGCSILRVMTARGLNFEECLVGTWFPFFCWCWLWPYTWWKVIAIWDSLLIIAIGYATGRCRFIEKNYRRVDFSWLKKKKYDFSLVQLSSLRLTYT